MGEGRLKLWLVAATVASALVVLAWMPGTAGAQAPGKAAAKGNPNPPRGKVRANPGDRKKIAPNAADPLAPKPKDDDKDKEKKDKDEEGGSVVFKFQLHAFDDTELNATYYPARIDTSSPVVLLIHEKDRSSKDFDDPIADLKGRSLAEHLQDEGYAVLDFDLRGYGGNARRAVADREWQGMALDLQAAFQFLVDRHNRGELNLAKLGVVGLGEGANLAAAWAHTPGGAVTSEGRTTDICAMALVSPMAEGSGLTLPAAMNALSTRIPTMLMVGERDNASHEAVKRVRAGVEKTRQNKVELFPSALHGYKLLRLEPRAATVLTKFLDSSIKFRAVDWEPRYNLTPVSLSNVEISRKPKPQEKAKEAEKPKEPEKAKEAEKPKEPEKDAEKPKEKAKDSEAR